MKRLPASAVLSCTFAVAIAMGGAMHNGFVYDDPGAISANPLVTDSAQWHLILASPYYHGVLWRPLATFGYALQWWIGAGAAWVFHLVSLLGYLAIGLLLFSLIRRSVTAGGVAWLAAVWFLVHPVHVEVVANAVGQAELWCALALLAATGLYLRSRAEHGTNVARAAVMAAVVLAIMAKEQGFVAPALLLGTEWFLVERRSESTWHRYRTIVLVGVVAVIMLLLRSSVIGTMAGENPAAAFVGTNPLMRAMTLLYVMPEYFRLLVWPLHLQADYSPPQMVIGGPWQWQHTFGLVLLLAGALACWRYRRRAPLVSMGLWWAAIALAPVSNVIAVTGIVMAERVFFLPTVGFAMALGGALDGLVAMRSPGSQRRFTIPVVVVVLSWCVGAAFRSRARVPVWHDEGGFYRALPLDAPNSYRAWSATANHLVNVGDSVGGVADFRHALALWPYNVGVFEDLATVLRAGNRCTEAIPVLEQGLPLDPQRATIRAKLVECLIVTRDWDTAERYAREGVALGQRQFAIELQRIAERAHHREKEKKRK